MSNPRRLLHFVLQILLAAWLGVGAVALLLRVDEIWRPPDLAGRT